MQNIPFEVWEHRVSELLDKKLKPIKTRLQNLAKAHDSVTNQMRQELLRTQRFAASLQINFACTQCLAMRNSLKPETRNQFSHQIVAAASAAHSEIDTSSDPLSIAETFYSDWIGYLKNQGVSLVVFES